MQDAFVVALERWPRDGVPDNPGAWITHDRAQQGDRPPARASALEREAAQLERARGAAAASDDDEPASAIPDDRLRLIFTCCHPALAPEAQVALTLRTLGGLTTREIARAFLVAEADDGAAARARQAQDPRRAASRYERAAAASELPERLRVGAGGALPDLQRGLRGDGAATRWSAASCAPRRSGSPACCVALMPDEPEALGLLALMLLHDSRRDARVDADGRLVLLDDQDRTLWDRGRDRRGPRARASARCALGARRPVPAAGGDRGRARAARRGGPDWRGSPRSTTGCSPVDPTPGGRAQPRGRGRDGATGRSAGSR